MYWQEGGPTSRRGIQRQKEGGGKVQELREELDKLHHEAKSKVKEGMGVGGGVSLWPAMDDMRLSREDVWKLSLLSVVLVICTFAVFNFYHGGCMVCGVGSGCATLCSAGTHLSQLKSYTTQLQQFPLSHSLLRHTSHPDLFRQELLTWHRDFLNLQNSIHQDFDVVWAETSASSNLILALYIVSPPPSPHV